MAIHTASKHQTRSLKDIVRLLEKGDYEPVLSQSEHITISMDEVKPYMFFDKDRYTRNCIARDEFFELVLLCWEPGQKTAIHCHNNQECWVKVVSGSFAEELYRLDDVTGEVSYIKTEILSQHEVTSVEDANVFHNLANINRGQSMSLHLYMKPIEECRVYDLETSELKKVSLCYDTFEGKRCS
jgi:cysteine dioxygenase